MSNLYGKCIKELATLPEKQNELNKLQNNYNTSPKVMKLLSSFGESSSIIYTYNKVAADRNNRIKELKKEIADISKQSFDLACKLEEKRRHEKAMALIIGLENYNGILGNIDEIKLKVTNSVKLQAVRRKITIITSGIVCFAIFCVVLFTFFIPQYKYKKALYLLANKEYEKAYTILNEIPKFKDSKNQLLNGKYSQAIDLKNSGSYIEAISIFEELGDYNDSKTQVIDTKYIDGIYQLNLKEYEKAIENFEDVKDYKDAKEYLLESQYLIAKQKFDNNEYQEAVEVFEKVSNYKDANNYIKYYSAIHLGNIDKSIEQLKSLPQDFYDVSQRIDFLTKSKEISGNYKNANCYGKWIGSYEDGWLWSKHDNSFYDINISLTLNDDFDIIFKLNMIENETEYRKRWHSNRYNSKTKSYGDFDEPVRFDWGENTVNNTGTIYYDDFKANQQITISSFGDNLNFASGVLTYKRSSKYSSSLEFSTTK